MANPEHTDAARLARLEQALGSLTGETALTLTPSAIPMAALAAQSSHRRAASAGPVNSRSASVLDTLSDDGGFSLAASRHPPTLSSDSDASDSYQQVNVRSGSASGLTIFQHDTLAPDALRIYEPVAGDGVVAAWEADQRIHVRGRAETEPGATVTLTFGDQSWQSSVNEWGYWNASMPSHAMQGLPDGNYSFMLTITDKVGNSAATQVDFGWYVDCSLKPTLTLDPIMEDNAVGCQEGMYGMQISGGSTHLPNGAKVTVTLNDTSYQGWVDSNGRWYVSLNDTELGMIPDGIYAVVVSATDPNGKVASATTEVTLITHWESLPEIYFDTVTRDNVINALELQQALTLTGSLSRVLPGQTLYLDDGGDKSYEVTVQADGRWRLQIPAEEVADFIHRGELHAWAKDGAGNFVDGQFEFNIITTLPPVYYELDIGGDLVLDYQEAQRDLSFYIEGVKSLILNGKTYEPVAGMVTLSSADLLALPDGAVDVTLWQQDVYGNSATHVLTHLFTVATHSASANTADTPSDARAIGNGESDSWLNNLTADSRTASSAPDPLSTDASLLARLPGDAGHWQTQNLPEADSRLTAELPLTLADLLQGQHGIPALP